MELLFIQYEYQIDIYKDDLLFLRVLQKVNFWDKKTLDFYKNDKHILQITDNTLFYTRTLKITSQKLEHIICFKKNHLAYDNTAIMLKLHFFKKKFGTFIIDSIDVGYIRTDFWFQSLPKKYYIHLECNETEMLYCLILLIIKLPSSLD